MDLNKLEEENKLVKENLINLIDERSKLKNKIEEIENTELSELKSSISQIEHEIKKMMNSLDIDKIQGLEHSASLKINQTIEVINRQEFIEYALKNQHILSSKFYLLNKIMKEMEEDGVVPPGIEFGSFQKVSFRKK